MVRESLKNLVSKYLSYAGKWQQQQLRSLNLHAHQVVARSHVHAGGRGWGTLKDGFRGGDYIAKADQAADLTGSIGSWKGSLVGAKIHTTAIKEAEFFGSSRSASFVKGIAGILDEDKESMGGSQYRQNTEGQQRHNTEEKPDIVHIKLIKNNTFVTITDSKGNKKVGASSGCLEEMKGGPKLSRYAAEATAEHVGRLARNLGLKSVVMRVNGFTHFKKKKQAILGWREGYTFGKGDHTPITFIEDTTRLAHNGCRLPKKRRV
ncbi:hypothetical protein BVRB_7g168200 [Beta vulgaris subsp. vulgaris]|uniref:Ribosomal protein S11 n=1 Tax=Beta vulgaris subsp. vulgaris TaxID=3555 RepID=A0A0J8BWP6_BETVV|nr:hypothetical protein BVRB_7g168200 [Beta vulgaris subsp. vulgaris]